MDPWIHERNAAISWHFKRDPIPYALETDWPLGVAGFEPLHLRIGIRQDSQPWGGRIRTSAFQNRHSPRLSA
jgi:hypothetical protein